MSNVDENRFAFLGTLMLPVFYCMFSIYIYKCVYCTCSVSWREGDIALPIHTQVFPYTCTVHIPGWPWPFPSSTICSGDIPVIPLIALNGECREFRLLPEAHALNFCRPKLLQILPPCVLSASTHPRLPCVSVLEGRGNSWWGGWGGGGSAAAGGGGNRQHTGIRTEKLVPWW
jgi:hypothetical protein